MHHQIRFRALVATLVLAAGCGGAPVPEPKLPAQSTGRCAILAINDTYRIEPLAGGKGGMARVRALRQTLEKSYPDLVVLHAGDMLSPSLLSRMYKGSQMIGALSRLDGSDAFDERFFVTFGNHEFDNQDANVLSARLGESGFHWVSANVHFKAGAQGKPTVSAPEGRLLPRTIVPCGGLRLGVFGVTIESTQPDYVERIDDPIATARAQSAALRKEGADAVVGLTHLSMTTDQKILAELGAEGPDVIVGGHEHQRQKAEVNGRGVYKADADAVSASVIRIERAETGIRVSHEWIALEGAAAPEDPALRAYVDKTLREHEQKYCTENLGKNNDLSCLSEVLSTAGEDLVAEELEIRRFETNLGDWIADLALAAFPNEKQRPSIAFVNSGTLRLNVNVPKGEPITRQTVEELFAYPAELRIIEINGETLQKIANRSIEGWTGQGHFLQIAGFAFQHDPIAKTAGRLTMLGNAPRRIDPKEMIRAVTVDFLINPKAGNQDGYTMLGPSQVIAPSGPDLKQLVVDALGALKKEGKPLAPKMEGRVCNPERKGPCLAL